MDLVAWKKYKRSGTYRREVAKRRLRQVPCGSRDSVETIDSRHSQAEKASAENGSVQNNNFVEHELGACTQITINSSTDDNFSSDLNESTSECSYSDTENKNKDLCDGMRNWAIEFNISHEAIKSISQLINNRIPNVLPKDPRTLLGTPTTITISPMGTGHYWHNGLTKALNRYLLMINHYDMPAKISLNVNIDGLPAFKSSKYQLWPILCNIYELPKLPPIVIGVYSGQDKPSDINDYLRMFVDEIKGLLECGLPITVNGFEKIIGVQIRAFICDSPARALIKGVCNFNGKNGCLKCTIEGEYSYVSHTVIFPRVGCPKRTNEDFRAKKYGQHHKMDSPLLELPVDIIEDFVVGDALHLIDLGIMKRLLTGWRDGKFGNYRTKWSSHDVAIVSSFLLDCKMPKEIHRSVRGVDSLAFWKGSEYRTFLYYLSFIILRYSLSSDAYQHFLCFFCAITICSNETYFYLLDLADSLLNCFLENFRDIYGVDYMTSNVHNLSHIVDEVRKFGKLQEFSAYPFENRLYTLKKMIRHGNKPLAQVARRIIEKDNIELESFDTDNVTYM